jgi:hypothetical protein
MHLLPIDSQDGGKTPTEQSLVPNTAASIYYYEWLNKDNSWHKLNDSYPEIGNIRNGLFDGEIIGINASTGRPV